MHFETIPELDRTFLAIVAVVVLISAAPAMLHVLKEYGPEIRQVLGRRFRLVTPELEAEPDAE